MERLIRMSQANQSEQLKITLNQWDKKTQKDLILAYTDYLVHDKQVAPTEETEKKFSSFLKVSDVILDKKVCPHFYDCQGDTVVNTQGLKKILKIFQMDRTTEIVEFEGLKKALDAMPNNQEKTFFVWHKFVYLSKDKKMPTGRHITPIFVKKGSKKEDSVVIVTDSTGQKGEFTESVLEKIKSTQMASRPIQIYSSRLQRQKDSYSCPVFSLLDAQAHREENFFQHIQHKKTQSEADSNSRFPSEDSSLSGAEDESKQSSAGSSPRSVDLGKYVFSVESCTAHGGILLPVSLMNAVQSFTELEGYLNAAFEEKDKPIKTCAGINTLEEVHNKYAYLVTQDREQKKKSGFVRKQAYLYYGELLKSLVQEEPKPKGIFSCFGSQCKDN
ncbi:MAG: hypothetical protein ACO3A2_11615 [Bdellovibrionia bacterium]